MVETSYFWDGLITGDATLAPYDDDEYSDMIRELITFDRTLAGIMRTDLTGYDGGLVVTNPTGNTIRVATGVALVDGKMYRNSANVDFTADTSSRYYRVVLTKDFTAQEVRLELLGPSTTIPTLTQNDGVEWQIPIYTVYYDGSSYTITDERAFLPRIFTENLEDDAVTTAKIADGAITAAKIAIGAQYYDLIQRLAVSDGDTSILFSSIPASFTHLRLVGALLTKGTPNYLHLRFNGDSGANYTTMTSQIGTAAGGGLFSSIVTGATAIAIGHPTANASNSLGHTPITIDIPDYAGAQRTSLLALSNELYTTYGVQHFRSGYWDNVAAITTIEIMLNFGTGEFAGGSVMSLYGLA